MDDLDLVIDELVFVGFVFDFDFDEMEVVVVVEMLELEENFYLDVVLE